MTDLKVLKVVNETRTLTVELPDDIPLGLAEVSISVRPVREAEKYPGSEPPSERETVRAKLRAGNFLVEPEAASTETPVIEDADLPALGRLPPHARPTEELIDEDRGKF
jgi:hypothetical protein